MPRALQSKGICAFCQKEVTKGTALRHIQTCPARQAVVDRADASPAGKPGLLFYLRVRDAYLKDFWLDLEVNATAKLKDLDRYLRAIWLECCGHQSQFALGGLGGRTAAMTRPVGDVLANGEEWTHVYDFGDSSETMVKAVAARTGKSLTSHPVVLLVRNVVPRETCLQCQEPATWLCQECVAEDETTGMLCDTHKRKHSHRDYGEPVPLVNSPRLGRCGYTGPAIPLY